MLAKLPTKEPREPKKPRDWLQIGLIILLISLLGLAAGYIYYVTSSPPQILLVNNTPTINNTTTKAPTLINISTSNVSNKTTIKNNSIKTPAPIAKPNKTYTNTESDITNSNSNWRY